MDRFFSALETPDVDQDELEKDFDKGLIEMLIVSSKEDTTGVLGSFKESLSKKIADYETKIFADITRDWKATEEQMI